MRSLARWMCSRYELMVMEDCETGVCHNRWLLVTFVCIINWLLNDILGPTHRLSKNSRVYPGPSKFLLDIRSNGPRARQAPIYEPLDENFKAS